MPEQDAIVRVAREKMGVMSRMATGEFTMLARLLGPDEPILAMAVGKAEGWWFAGRLVVATPQRVLVVGKAMITRRERVREIPLSRIRSARATPPGSLELELDDEVLRFSYMVPPPQLSALAAAARGGAGSERFSELDALARRKLGRFMGFAVEPSLVALAEELEPDEAVVDLAFSTGKPGGIIAVCDRRLLAVPDKGVRSGTAPTSVAYDEIVEVRCDGDDLFVRTTHGEHRFEDLAPRDRASVIARRVGAQVPRAESPPPTETGPAERSLDADAPR
ncbi:MAG: PH domain-containing protein [Actinobacteria bacterium]|nr:PH domain-containing protein [Actinomycetota bacterium]